MQNVPHACSLANKPLYTAGFKGNPATHHCSTLCVCACGLSVYVHLSVYSAGMDYCKIMLPLTLIHRLKFPGLRRPSSNVQWKLMWEKMKDKSDFHQP